MLARDTAITSRLVLLNEVKNPGPASLASLSTRTLASAPTAPRVLYVSRPHRSLEASCILEGFTGGLPVESFTVQVVDTDGQVVGEASVAAEGNSAVVVVHDLPPSLGSSDLVVNVSALNSLGPGEVTSVVARPEIVIAFEVDLGALVKNRFDQAQQEGVRRLFSDVIASVPHHRAVTIVSVREGSDCICLEVEVEPSVLITPAEALAEVKALVSSTSEALEAMAEQLRSNGAGLEALTFIRFKDSAHIVNYARTGWLQLVVQRAENLFHNQNEREAHLVVEVGAASRSTKNLAVFKEQVTAWNQRFEFEGVEARDQTVVFTVWSRKKEIESCRLDMVRDLYPGISQVQFKALSGDFSFECTWHPRSHADREVSKQRHTVCVDGRS
eukprot:c19745_g1_i5.p1 GENE.c19745_g1_i5~~c19745_g1_i5.p1  ORF type:complete len:386 (+),score=91.66 c19745_g1_i5:1864-3021(+)